MVLNGFARPGVVRAASRITRPREPRAGSRAGLVQAPCRYGESLPMGNSDDAQRAHCQRNGGDSEPGDQGAGPVIAPANAPRWWQAFRGDAHELRSVRRWLESLLPDCPARDDVISVATELGSNAVLHTASGDNGVFEVEITSYRSMMRVAVTDRGGPAEPQIIEDPEGEQGRGLLLVRGLSVRTGVEGDHRGRAVWAEIAWEGPGTATVSTTEVGIRDGEDALARCFPGVVSWFGRSTQEWWALTSRSELVAAPSAAELASLLHRPDRGPVSLGHRSE